MMKIRSRNPMSDMDDVVIEGFLLFFFMLTIAYSILNEKFSTLSFLIVEITFTTF